MESTSWACVENLCRTLPASFSTCTCGFSCSALSSWWFATHQSKRAKMRSLFPLPLAPTMEILFLLFLFLGSRLIFGQISRTHLFHRLVFHTKKDHIMNLTRYFLEKANMFLLERESPPLLLIIWWKECSYQLQTRPLYWFFSFQRTRDTAFCKENWNWASVCGSV